jgi:RNA polymerase sigma-70 factor (ECF subfamily)
MGSVKRISGSYQNAVAEKKKDLELTFKEYFKGLVYFSYQLVNNRSLAEDIVQEVFVSYWHRLENDGDEIVSVKSFLYGSVKNASLNHIRHEKVKENYRLQQTGDEPLQAPVIEAIIKTEVFRELHKAIGSLDEKYRMVSVLGFLEGKKNHEIADELNLSVNTVKKQKQKALELLRLRLSPELFLLLPGIVFLADK